MNLRLKREKKGLTQQQLANIINMDRTLITKIESGVSSPGVETAKKIAKALDFDWTRFYEDPDEQEKTNQGVR